LVGERSGGDGDRYRKSWEVLYAPKIYHLSARFYHLSSVGLLRPVIPAPAVPSFPSLRPRPTATELVCIRTSVFLISLDTFYHLFLLCPRRSGRVPSTLTRVESEPPILLIALGHSLAGLRRAPSLTVHALSTLTSGFAYYLYE